MFLCNVNGFSVNGSRQNLKSIFYYLKNKNLTLSYYKRDKI